MSDKSIPRPTVFLPPGTLLLHHQRFTDVTVHVDKLFRLRNSALVETSTRREAIWAELIPQFEIRQVPGPDQPPGRQVPVESFDLFLLAVATEAAPNPDKGLSIDELDQGPACVWCRYRTPREPMISLAERIEEHTKNCKSNPWQALARVLFEIAAIRTVDDAMFARDAAAVVTAGIAAGVVPGVNQVDAILNELRTRRRVADETDGIPLTLSAEMLVKLHRALRGLQRITTWSEGTEPEEAMIGDQEQIEPLNSGEISDLLRMLDLPVQVATEATPETMTLTDWSVDPKRCGVMFCSDGPFQKLMSQIGKIRNLVRHAHPEEQGMDAGQIDHALALLRRVTTTVGNLQARIEPVPVRHPLFIELDKLEGWTLTERVASQEFIPIHESGAWTRISPFYLQRIGRSPSELQETAAVISAMKRYVDEGGVGEFTITMTMKRDDYGNTVVTAEPKNRRQELTETLERLRVPKETEAPPEPSKG